MCVLNMPILYKIGHMFLKAPDDDLETFETITACLIRTVLFDSSMLLVKSLLELCVSNLNSWLPCNRLTMIRLRFIQNMEANRLLILYIAMVYLEPMPVNGL